MQNAASIVIDSRHARTRRLNQSSATARYDEAARHRDVGNVHRPNLVRPRDRQPAQQIWVDFVARLGFGRARTAIERLYPHPLHQRLHVTAADLAPLGHQQAASRVRVLAVLSGVLSRAMLLLLGAAAEPARPAPPAATAVRPAPSTPTGPAEANQFSTEAQAKARCPSDTVVWVNLTSKIYHFSGTKVTVPQSTAHTCAKVIPPRQECELPKTRRTREQM